MARISVQQIMQFVAASTNQDPTMPTAGGDEYNLFLSFLNRAVQEFAEAHDWEDLRAEFYPVISGTTQATIALPQNFSHLAASPVHWGTGVTGGEEWPEILPEQRKLLDSTAQWIQVRGDINNGFNLIWNPGTLASGASIVIQYFSLPTSLASPAQVPLVPDSQFLVDRVTAYVWQVRSDPRYQAMEATARERLLNMVNNADAKKFSSYSSPNPVISSERRLGFRLGRD